MTDGQISKIVADITDKFGMPGSVDVDEDWLMMENARRTLAGGVKKPNCIAPLIDHTLLKPDATVEDIDRLCDETLEHRFASVCVNPCYVAEAAKKLGDSTSVVCTVVGFPLGANTAEIKTAEAIRAVEGGAEEIDMVMNIGFLKSGALEAVYSDIVSVVDGVYPVPVKVILETALLSDGEIVTASALSASAGAAYVKTSTGFSKGGATAGAVDLMARTVGTKLGVKASGGIGDFETALKMVKTGATRIGASRSLNIIWA